MASLANTERAARAFEKTYEMAWADGLRRAVGRLQEAGIDADVRRGRAVDEIVLAMGSDEEAAHRVATEQPYVGRSGLEHDAFFLPLFRPVPQGWAQWMDTFGIAWGGSLEASRLVTTVRGPRDTTIVYPPLSFPGLATVRRVNHQRVELRPLVPCRMQGRVVGESAKVLYPCALVAGGQITVVFGDLDELFPFVRAPRAKLWSGATIGAWELAAMDVAFQRGQRFSLTAIAGSSAGALDGLPATNLERTCSFGFGQVWVVAVAADEDALLVHSDQMKEHFSEATITEAFAAPGEDPESVLARIKG